MICKQLYTKNDKKIVVLGLLKNKTFWKSTKNLKDVSAGFVKSCGFLRKVFVIIFSNSEYVAFYCLQDYMLLFGFFALRYKQVLFCYKSIFLFYLLMKKYIEFFLLLCYNGV